MILPSALFSGLIAHYSALHSLLSHYKGLLIPHTSSSTSCFRAFALAVFALELTSLAGGNGNPLQYSCLENPRDGGAWWAAVSGVAQSRTRLKLLSSNSPLSEISQIEKYKYCMIFLL